MNLEIGAKDSVRVSDGVQGLDFKLSLMSIDDDKPGGLKHSGDTFSRVTQNREDLLTHFWQTSGLLEPTTMEQDKAKLSQPDAIKCIEAGPDVELCAENRIGIERVDFINCKRLVGKFFLVRTLTPATNTVWLDVVVDDPTGKNAAFLHLLNFTPSKYSKDVAINPESGSTFLGALPRGSFIAVKNAYPRIILAKVHPLPTFMPEISCYNPGDVILLTPRKIQKLFPGLEWTGYVPSGSLWDDVLARKADPEIVNVLTGKGNEALAFRRYTDAIRCYDLALDYISNNLGDCTNTAQHSMIWVNKAAAFLGMGCFLQALVCCEYALTRDPFNPTAIYRKVRSQVGLGIDYCGEALEFLTSKLEESPRLRKNKELQDLIKKIPPGTSVDFDDLMGFGIESYGPIDFCLDPNTKRGIFADRDIEPGTIGIATVRSFATVVAIEDETQEEKGGHLFSAAELVSLIANKVAFSPITGQDIYPMWSGSEFAPLTVEDTENTKVHISRIQNLVQHNSRYTPNSILALTHPNYAPSWVWGIHPFLSQLNHSCSGANIQTRHHNGWTFVRATKPIKKGEEILMHWTNVTDRLELKQEELRRLGMTCSCDLCQRDAKDSAEVKRKFEKLWNRFNAKAIQDDFASCSRQKVDSALAILNELEKLRHDAPHLNSILTHPNVTAVIRDLYARDDLFLKRNMDKYSNIAGKVALVAETMNNLDTVVSIGIGMTHAYLDEKMVPEAIEWAKKVKEYHMILNGKSSKGCTFDDKLMAKMKALGINAESL